MKTLVLIIMVLFIQTHQTTAQSISPSVIATSGGFYTTSLFLSFTTGEMTMVETFQNPSQIITQGFQQPWPWDTSVSVHEINEVGINASIYPNPSHGSVHLNVSANEAQTVSIKVFDMLAREVFSTKYEMNETYAKISLDMSSLKPGLYHVQLQFSGRHNTATYLKQIKIQIIK